MLQTRLGRIISFVLVGLAISIQALGAQEIEERHVYGDSTLKTIITPQTRAIYDQAGTWVFLLTQTNPLRLEGAYATELRGKALNGRFNHVLATAWTTEGKYSAEYYLIEEVPIFIYETFEYFEQSAPSGAWRNFKGLAAWERRSYFGGSSIGYAEAWGGAELVQDAISSINTTRRMLGVLVERLP